MCYHDHVLKQKQEKQCCGNCKPPSNSAAVSDIPQKLGIHASQICSEGSGLIASKSQNVESMESLLAAIENLTMKRHATVNVGYFKDFANHATLIQLTEDTFIGIVSAIITHSARASQICHELSVIEITEGELSNPDLGDSLRGKLLYEMQYIEGYSVLLKNRFSD
ncbi:hypothetical protein [Neptuniibacter sp. QD37_11]|uniref:hypothetical protein n=1 Tax=Neptuniibacter sp. QD37_11 TaxID=3398209 RepID=UPI0039F59059